jgi:murein L,D-transpeptidase YafK
MQNNGLIIKLFSLLVLSVSLFSSDILTQYRMNGIENIEKQLDIDLMQKEYWSQHLKDKDTSFGYIESYSNILTCDKSESTLTLYRKDLNNSYRVKKEYSAFTGKIKGDKYKEGDLKTPVGIYNITKKISKVDSFYGPMAFVTSYPNVYDRYKGKNGSGIWIHGLPTEQERDEFTKGCIAINNSSIECLDRNIDITKTLLIINETKVTKNVSKETLSELLSQLYAWRYAWLYNNIDNYLNFYATEFRRFDGMNRDTFIKYKTRVFNKQEKKSIVFNDLTVIPYPNLPETYKITFKEIYESESFSFIGNKVLIAKLVDKKLKIVTEK